MPHAAQLHSLFDSQSVRPSVRAAGAACSAWRQGLASVTRRGSWLPAWTGAGRFVNCCLTLLYEHRTPWQYVPSPLREAAALECRQLSQRGGQV